MPVLFQVPFDIMRSPNNRAAEHSTCLYTEGGSCGARVCTFIQLYRSMGGRMAGTAYKE